MSSTSARSRASSSRGDAPKLKVDSTVSNATARTSEKSGTAPPRRAATRERIRKRYTGANARSTGANDSKSAPHRAVLGVGRRTTQLELYAPPISGPGAATQCLYFFTGQTEVAQRVLGHVHGFARATVGHASGGRVNLVAGHAKLRMRGQACL